MASDTRYCNKPGGVLVHVTDEAGAPVGVQHVKYGDPLPDNMTENQAKVATRFSTTDSPKPESDVRNEIAARANEKAALDEGGQVGSSSSPVPGNYAELDEQGATRFVSSLKDFPKEQAAVVVHETLNANRREVVDAASSEARNIAEEILRQQANEGASAAAVASGEGSATPVPVDVSALEARVEELATEVETLRQGEITGQAPEVDPEDYTEAELRDMADKAGVEDVKSGDNKAEIAAKINAHNAASGPSPSASPEG